MVSKTVGNLESPDLNIAYVDSMVPMKCGLIYKKDDDFHSPRHHGNSKVITNTVIRCLEGVHELDFVLIEDVVHCFRILGVSASDFLGFLRKAY